MVNLALEKKQCCGCTACMEICPKDAILMKKDKEGFFYPKIDGQKCIECKMCTNICAFNKEYDINDNLDKPKSYAVTHKNEVERSTSRSGGAFVALAEEILEKNGVVYGAAFDGKFKVKHKRITNKNEISKLKGSKYVQSEMEETFSHVKKDLLNGKYVLFSGTPCQTSGLKSFLKKVDKKKLYLCDIICHGVPSPLIWEEYLKFIEKKYKSEILSVNFRDKSYGWHTHFESYLIKKNKKIKLEYYTNLFRKNIILRPCCEECKFANINRPSDITLGDFWGIKKALPYYKDDDKGVSLILLNTKKGEELFNNIKKEINYEKVDISKCLQPNLKGPSKPLINREDFWNDYYSNDFKIILKKYGGYNIKDKTKKIIYRNIIKPIKIKK